jgi:flagellar hook assembly protein FlgD
VASTTRVFGAVPNPSRSDTSVRVLLAAPSAGGTASYDVRAEVYDLAGRRVQSVFGGRLPSGPHSFVWDGRDGSGRSTGAGVYFLRVTVDGEVAGTAKITRVR